MSWLGQRRKFIRLKNGRFDKTFHRRGQTDDAGDVFRAGATFIFMAAAENDRDREEGAI